MIWQLTKFLRKKHAFHYKGILIWASYTLMLIWFLCDLRQMKIERAQQQKAIQMSVVKEVVVIP